MSLAPRCRLRAMASLAWKPQLRRDASAWDAEPSLWYSPAKIGDFVARGPHWPLGSMVDGGPGGLGKVTNLSKEDMKVSGTDNPHE